MDEERIKIRIGIRRGGELVNGLGQGKVEAIDKES